jgi:hypothetical protein
MGLSKLWVDLLLPNLGPILTGLGVLGAFVFAFLRGKKAGEATAKRAGDEALVRNNQAWRQTRIEPARDPELERLGTVDQPTKADIDALERKVQEL